MRISGLPSIAVTLGTLPLFLTNACKNEVSNGLNNPIGSLSTTTTSPPGGTNICDAAAASLHGIVYGMPDTSVPAGVDIPATIMGQIRALFDLIKEAPDFTKVVMDLGDGSPIPVLDTNTGDKFLPGKLALGLSYILIDMKTKEDPNYADYLAVYQKITTAMMAQISDTHYLYANNAWGEYYYLVALNNFKEHGMLSEVFSNAMLATLENRLTFCDMFGVYESGKLNTCPATGGPIDIASLNTAQNYYAVAYGIAGLRQKLGWSNLSFSSSINPAVASMSARDALLYALINHLRNSSSGGFSDEVSNTHTTYYDQGQFDRYSVLLIAEIVERTLEMGNESNLTQELKGYLRESVDLIFPQLNTDGQGFNYGRSLGPYGDSAFAEILTAAASIGELSEQEMQIAYSFIYKSAHRFSTFWYDPTLPTPSVNMWVKGRGTDGYRSKPRAMGENFSLLHQYMYMNARWNKLDFRGKALMPDSAFQAWLDARPHCTLTFYNLPTDKAHPYSAALITARDGKRVINLNLSQASGNYWQTPYYPIPFSDKLIYGTADLSYALLIPQVSYNGKTYIPVTYYKNLSVQESDDQIIVSFDTAHFRQAVKNAEYATDIDLQTHTILTFSRGTITRTDTLSSATLTENITVETDFTSFADFQNTTLNDDGFSATYANSDAKRYGTMGFDNCVLSNFETASGETNRLSTTPIGQLHSNFACTTRPFALKANHNRTFTWALEYA